MKAIGYGSIQPRGAVGLAGPMSRRGRPAQPAKWGWLPFHSSHVQGLLGLLMCCLPLSMLTGCARLQLPAIDPTGSRVFLPFPNTTQLAVPHLHDRPGEPASGFLPAPAFAAPATPPPCVDGGTPGGVCNLFQHKHNFLAKIHDHFRSPGKAGELQLTPLRVVAPVQGEVVLLAGVCGPDGYLVQRERLEWMLSPDSVGQFIEVGDDSRGKLIGLVHGPVAEKLDVDFARGKTSNRPQVITRGTPQKNDDIQLRNGETWLSISSPSEGVSRVTVLAPDSESWDRRRQTATIYWVDADWQFPAPQVARSGETIQLVTRVTKSENLVPAEGWTVRYTLADPSVAAFVGSSGPTLNVPVNANGQAIAQITSVPGGRGTSPVLIEVISPPRPTDNLPELTLGSGQTAVTFSSAGLDLQVFGPELGAPGEQLTYTATLGNPGDVDAENVSLRMIAPAGTRIVGASLEPSQQVNNGLVWDQGLLPARQQLIVSVVLEAPQPATFEVSFEAAGGGGGGAGPLSARQSVRTEIVQSSVDVRFAPAGGVSQAEVGEQVQYDIDIVNTGRSTLTNLEVLIESTPGLTEAYQGETTVSQSISMLQPGGTRSIGIAFDVRQEGQQTVKLTLRSGNVVLAERSASILGLPPRPKQPDVRIDLQIQEALRIGEQALASLVLRNSGEVRLSGIRVEMAFDPELEIAGAENLNEFRVAPDGRSAVWTPPDLLPRLPGNSGDMIRRFQLAFRGKAAIAEAAIRVRVTTAEGVNAEDTATVQIVGTTPPPTTPTPSAPAARTGSLSIYLGDLGDPTNVGGQFRYALRVTNDSNLPNRNVRVEMRLPQGLEVLEVTTDGTRVATQRDGDVLRLPAIQYMRPGEYFDYIVLVSPSIPQTAEAFARAYSDEQPEPVQDSETTTILPRR
jgi:uncharacterized repeat protein (TIGR01451 family)